MRQTFSRANVGDFISTKKSFTPVDDKGKKVDLYGDLFHGVIVSKKKKLYGVRFGGGLDFTHTLDGLLSKQVGCYLGRDDFDIVEEN